MSDTLTKAPELNLISIEDEMKRSYLDYAMSVIVSRAVPDVRDGLKPVHRRILYAMYEGGYHATKPRRKSATIVGDVMGKYHPHGDSAIYDSLVRMAQNFSLRVPLVDGQGNFGSMDGDAPAAMRYTEARLAKVTHSLVEDIDKETVDFAPNYDGTESEPRVLPAMFPNLLVNGTSGIAVGMATNIPPHNLNEIIDACCLYIDNHDVEIEQLIEVVKGPDFPTAGIIMGTNAIKSAYLTGRGTIVTRGRTVIEEHGNRESIIITEIPYAVNKARLVEKIADLVKEKKIEGISDLRDESNKEGVRVVIELKKETQADILLNQLYSYTQLQTSFGVIMLALDNDLPKVMNLKEIIVAFIKFREQVITKRTIFLLNKARDRAHILLGLRIAVANIDEIIRLIKAAPDTQTAKDQLMNRRWLSMDIGALIKIVDHDAVASDDDSYNLTEIQAKAILEMRLQRLTAMEKNRLEEELTSLAKEIEEHLIILASRVKLLTILKDELLKIKKDYGTPRLTEISENYIDQNIEDLILREEMVVTVTLGGYIKRVPLATYKAQKRGGKGRAGLSMRDEDITTQVFVGSTHTPMLFFSSLGQVYSLKLYQLPIGTPQSRGRPMVNLLPLKSNEHITNIMPMPEDQAKWDELHIMFATSLGNVRRNDLSDFKKVQSNGKIAIRLDENDSLVNVKVCDENDNILLATREGKAIRFPVSAVRVFKSRTSDGVRGMRLTKDDRVISMTVLKGIHCTMEDREEFLKIPFEKRLAIAKDEKFDVEKLGVNLKSEIILEMAKSEEFILTCAEKGFGKRSSAYSYRITNRGGSGVVNMDISTKTGKVVAVLPVEMDNEILLITNNGQLIRCKLNTVRVTGRNTSGVILFKTHTDQKVVSVSIIANDSSEELEELEELAHELEEPAYH